MSNGNQDHAFEEDAREGRSRHRWTADRTPTTAVVEVVARQSDTDPVALPPLYEAVDPDALDDLLCPRPERDEPVGVCVQFPYAGYRVTVDGDGWITVEANDVPDARRG